MENTNCSRHLTHSAPRTHTEVLPALSTVPEGCTLDAHALAERSGAFGELSAYLLASESFPGGFRFTFRNEPGVERKLRERVRSEHACCPYLTFAISVHGDQLAWSACAADTRRP